MTDKHPMLCDTSLANFAIAEQARADLLQSQSARRPLHITEREALMFKAAKAQSAADKARKTLKLRLKLKGKKND